MSSAIATHRITEENHQRFAELSGDLNPLHVDREAAKSMPPGQRLAYGMDMLLWALESLQENDQVPAALARVRTRFTKWVFIEDTLELQRAANGRTDSYELIVGEASVAAFDLLPGERRTVEPIDCTIAPTERRREPNALLLEELEGHEGLVPAANSARAANMYPALAQRFGPQWLCECATCSYIIGMEAPGLYSMSMKYDLQLLAAQHETQCVHFKVVAADERFRKIRIAVQGAAMAATLEAMVREPQ